MSDIYVEQTLDGGMRIDFHTHILPQVDDGSQSVDESLQMIRTLKNSGVTCIALTPHFYPQRDNPEQFLLRRDRAFSRLHEALKNSSDISDVHIIPGAEIEYFAGITCMKDYPELKLGESQCLLVEMPFGVWTSQMVDDILQLNSFGGCRIVIAHVERYLFEQKKDVINVLLDNGVVMQSNASFFIERRTSRFAMKMLKRGWIHILGTDCHSMTVRPPNISGAFEAIAKRLGSDTVDRMMAYAYDLLRQDIHSADTVPLSV